MKQITCRRILIPVAAGIIFLCLFFLLTTFASEKITYKIFFVDEEDYNTKIFNTQSGAVFEGESVSVSFPEQLIGNDGHIWQSVEKSPQTFEVNQSGIHKYYVEYRQGRRVVISEDSDEVDKEKLKQWLLRIWEQDCSITGQDPTSRRDPYLIVKNDSENNSRIRNLVSILDDRDWHYFYMIGKNYMPQTLVIGTGFNAVYSSVTEEEFSVKTDRYHVVKISVRRNWNPQNCFHDWQAVSDQKVSCLKTEMVTYQCERCGDSETVSIPSPGHRDRDFDSLCDRCGKRTFFQKTGDKIRATLMSGGKLRGIGFTCVDPDYNGTGKMLYLGDEVLDQSITGICFEENPEYNDSPVRDYLNQSFPNDCSLGSAILSINRADGGGINDYGLLLSKVEYETYQGAGLIKETSGGYFLRTVDSDSEKGKYLLAVKPDGDVVRVPEADRSAYGVRPCVLLDKPVTDDQAEVNYWKEGDIQIRQIGGKNYRFVCVDEDYSDSREGHRRAALFLCDSIIRSDIDSQEQEADFKKFSFGDINNYKTSKIRTWLLINGEDTLFDMEPVYTGVNTAYTGSTREGTFEQMSENHLEEYGIEFQLMQDQLFCLSLEEALKYKDYLWRFNGSESNNPESQISPYSSGYYLRTPFYVEDENGTFQYSKNIYVVDLARGNIHAAGTDSETYGLRPAFALPQE